MATLSRHRVGLWLPKAGPGVRPALAVGPAEPDRLVLTLVGGAPQSEAILGPDNRVGPVAAGLGQEARDEG